MQVGTKWDYKAGDNKYQIVVKSHEKVGNTLTARLELIKDGTVAAVEHVGLTSDGICRFDLTLIKGNQQISETPVPPLMLLKQPPKPGESWSVDARSAGRVYKGSFKISEEEVKVHAGTFKGARRVTSQDVVVDGLKPTITTWYAENVGMVKQVITEADQAITIELEKFTPGN
jgi:hypothetical protein